MTDTETYGALSMLEGEYAPLRNRREPYWMPKPPTIHDQVLTPTWSWRHRDWTPGTLLVELDTNAAYLAAASSVSVAHGALSRVGAPARGGDYTTHYKRTPGLYLIDWHEWAGGGWMPSPLGSVDPGSARVWVAHPTVELLVQLAESGHWPAVTIHDACVSWDSARLRKWAERVRDDREAALRATIANPADDSAAARLQAIKTGYAVAVQMLMIPPDPKGTPAEDRKKRNKAYRPDWYAAIHAQHAANHWRKCWRAGQLGHPPAAVGNTDAIWFTADDFQGIGYLEEHRLPFQVDIQGVKIGAMKVRGWPVAD